MVVGVWYDGSTLLLVAELQESVGSRRRSQSCKWGEKLAPGMSYPGFPSPRGGSEERKEGSGTTG